MRSIFIAAALAGFAAVPVHASDQEGSDQAQATDWSFAVAGGSAILQGGGNQPFARIAAARVLGDGYVLASATYFSTRDGPGLVDAVPAKTWQVLLGGGYSFGAVGLHGYAAIGRREFQREHYRRRNSGRAITIDSQGKSLAGGVTLTYALALDNRSVLSPFLAGDISRTDTARAVEVLGRGTVAQKERQNSETGSLGLTLDRLLGAGSEHRIEAYGGVVTTSNSAVAIRSSAPLLAARLFGPQDIPGNSDSWGEYGLSLDLRLAESVRLDLSAVRTAGYKGGEATSLYAGLRYLF